MQFQHMFLQSLEEAVQLEPNFSNLADPKQFRVGALKSRCFLTSESVNKLYLLYQVIVDVEF